MSAFRTRRSRHGRTVRSPLTAHLEAASALGFFETVVGQTVEFLKLSWPDDLANLDWRLADAPPVMNTTDEVPRYSINRQRFRITIYRIPIERLTHFRRGDRLDERFHIEQYVFQAAAELVGKDPGELIPERFKP